MYKAGFGVLGKLFKGRPSPQPPQPPQGYPQQPYPQQGYPS
jgi:hypothetical protein